MGTSAQSKKIQQIVYNVTDNQDCLADMLNILKYNKSIKLLKIRLPYGIYFDKAINRWCLFGNDFIDKEKFEINLVNINKIISPIKDINFVELLFIKSTKQNNNTKVLLQFSASVYNSNKIALDWIPNKANVFYTIEPKKVKLFRYLGTTTIKKQVSQFVEIISKLYNLYGEQINHKE